jgi:hypothetical protein
MLIVDISLDSFTVTSGGGEEYSIEDFLDESRDPCTVEEAHYVCFICSGETLTRVISSIGGFTGSWWEEDSVRDCQELTDFSHEKGDYRKLYDYCRIEEG